MADGTGHEVVVVGSANADLVVRVERRPGPGETVLGSDFDTHPGGKGANQAVAAALLGGRVALLGRVGDDGYGELLRDALALVGVDTRALLTTPAPTGVAFIAVGPDGENSIIVAPGANARLTPADVDPAFLAGARVVSLQTEIPVETVLAAARAATDAGVRTVLNLSPVPAASTALLGLCDVLVVNEHEAGLLLPGAARTPAALLALGPRAVVVTLGADGACVADETGETFVPAPPVEAVDTTGAGDAFTAALCLRLARGDGVVDAARFAVRVGAAAVRSPGAQASYPSAEDALPG
ncbi:Ribokinase [Actinomadura rubteroloni]|uniref:Ribokinase n=1 Tax=Actinomadura rubteroloni TaxID=1926885 RepID=A0A2P4UEK3_9ACTN|nr:ribokinase [Actinomadura rubteroloni]POM23442.1 Ribokinase [Actinomadura rubteroloni]